MDEVQPYRTLLVSMTFGASIEVINWDLTQVEQLKHEYFTDEG